MTGVASIEQRLFLGGEPHCVDDGIFALQGFESSHYSFEHLPITRRKLRLR